MAIYGNGADYDVTLKATSYLKTSTSQYCVVGMEAGTTTVLDFTVGLADNGQAINNTGTALYALGINQTRLSSGSEYCQVRMFGLSKAVCAESITAGQWVVAYTGISTTTHAGHISGIIDDTTTCYGMTLSSFITVIGRALEAGSTNTVITVFVNPQLYDRHFYSELS
jgi:hypothetical protein